MIKEVVYVGMTNSQSGLRGRLKQFDNTIQLKEGHGGAQRFRHEYRKYERTEQKLYLSFCYFEREGKVTEPTAKKNAFTPDDWRIMGEVAKLEYIALAEYLEAYKELPQFNRRSSPKWRKSHDDFPKEKIES